MSKARNTERNRRRRERRKQQRQADREFALYYSPLRAQIIMPATFNGITNDCTFCKAEDGTLFFYRHTTKDDSRFMNQWMLPEGILKGADFDGYWRCLLTKGELFYCLILDAQFYSPDQLERLCKGLGEAGLMVDFLQYACLYSAKYGSSWPYPGDQYRTENGMGVPFRFGPECDEHHRKRTPEEIEKIMAEFEAEYQAEAEGKKADALAFDYAAVAAEFGLPEIKPIPGHGDPCPACGKGTLETHQIDYRDSESRYLACPACLYVRVQAKASPEPEAEPEDPFTFEGVLDDLPTGGFAVTIRKALDAFARAIRPEARP